MAAARTRSRFDREEAGPQSDVYTGLLAISLIAMIASCILLFLDYNQYGASKAPPVPAIAPSQPKPISQGVLPPPPPLEDRPITKAPAAAPGLVKLPDPAPAPTTVTPVGGTESSLPGPIMPALGESPEAPKGDATPCPSDPPPLPRSDHPTPPG